MVGKRGGVNVCVCVCVSVFVRECVQESLMMFAIYDVSNVSIYRHLRKTRRQHNYIRRHATAKATTQIQKTTHNCRHPDANAKYTIYTTQL